MRPQRLRNAVVVVATLLAFTGAVLMFQGTYMTLKAHLSQVLLKRAFAQSLSSGELVKPWSWADVWPVARISFPRLSKSAIVLSGASGQALAFGPGHVASSPRPGEAGVALISGHRDTHFRFLKTVKIGDIIAVTRRDGRKFMFEAKHMQIVHWKNNRLPIVHDKPTLILSTCWPFDSHQAGPMRYVVYADLVPQTKPAPIVVKKSL